jgi:hypothetical protein
MSRLLKGNREAFARSQAAMENRPEAEAVRLLDEKIDEQMSINCAARLDKADTIEKQIELLGWSDQQRKALAHIKDHAYRPYEPESVARDKAARQTLDANVVALIDVSIYERDAVWMLAVNHRSMQSHPKYKTNMRPNGAMWHNTARRIAKRTRMAS